jgi:hypothetical protein
MEIKSSLFIVALASVVFGSMAHADYLSSIREVDAYINAEGASQAQAEQAKADRKIVRIMNAFANAHGGPVLPIQLKGNGYSAFRTSEFETQDGYSCAMFSDYGMVLSCANPTLPKKFTKDFKIR